MNTAECFEEAIVQAVAWALQWSRRVNTAECEAPRLEQNAEVFASMEPPCEHGGVLHDACSAGSASPCFNGAAV